MHLPSAFPRLCLVLAAAALYGCSSVGYYSQLMHGEYELLADRKPIAKLVADPATDPKLKARLELALEARTYASDKLDLPRNGSYTSYADIGRPYVMWNVFATPEFSLSAVKHCFPIAGCVSYLGYYSQQGAQQQADELKTKGGDVYVGGVPTFSTLGWFDDPVISTMLRWDDGALVSSIFHELAHQKLYVAGDTAFNESYATFVEEEGLRQWRSTHDLPSDQGLGHERQEAFTQLVLDTRERLTKVYASGLPPDQMRAAKQAEFERLRSDYRSLRDARWPGWTGYDRWIEEPINNAKLLPFGLYDHWVPAFAAIYAQHNRDWPAFFEAVKALSKEDIAMRERTLEGLLPPVATASR
jgi:predicted aminopeptidase